MCGICGIIDYSGSRIIDEDRLRKMACALKHRGPDDEGIFVEHGRINVGLGHRRLSIIDLSAKAHQPMSNEDNTVWIVFNGEIYNYRELREGLEEKGHKFKSDTDSEVILHLYEEDKDGCLRLLRGMFAFLIWDKKREIVFAARDRVGKKPFFYFFEKGIFCFASEIGSLLSANLIDKIIDYGALGDYLAYGYIPAPRSIFEKIKKLPAAHMLTLKDGLLRVSRYWQLDYRNKTLLNEEESARELLRLLKEAVKIRLYSDVPLGAFLSGGIDSATVVALMAELTTGRIRTFSIGFKEGAFNELRYAKLVADRYATDHNELVIRPDAMGVVHKLVEHYGEPYADSSCIPTYYVARETKRFVTVALSGDGGDESFAGYERYQAMIIADKLSRLPVPLSKLLFRAASRFPECGNSRSALGRFKRFMWAAQLPGRKRYFRWIGIFNEEMRERTYSKFLKQKTEGYHPWEIFSPYFSDRQNDLLDGLLEADVNTYLSGDLLVKMDIASMTNSLEVRSPFLDQKVMEFAAGLPARYKMRHLVKKYLLKKSVKEIIPAENIHRKKMGFGIPVGEWFRADLKEFLRENILSQKFFKRGYFEREPVLRMFEDHCRRKKDFTFQLWSILMLELWHQKFMD